MSKAHDRARAEYIKSHSRAERITAVWMFTAYFNGYALGQEKPLYRNRITRLYLLAKEWLMRKGYNMKQVDSFCDSVVAGLTSPILQCFHQELPDVFYILERVCNRYLDKFVLEDYYYMTKNKLWTACMGAILRAAFREAEHALIFLPRTTLSKKETVADAPHSS